MSVMDWYGPWGDLMHQRLERQRLGQNDRLMTEELALRRMEQERLGSVAVEQIALLRSQKAAQDEEVEYLKNPALGITRFFEWMRDAFGIDMRAAAGGEDVPGGGVEGAQAPLAATATALPALPQIPGISGPIPQTAATYGLPMAEAGIAPAGQPIQPKAGGPTWQPLVNALNDLPLAARKPVLDSFRERMESSARAITASFPGATATELQALIQKAQQGATDIALTMARGFQGQIDAQAARSRSMAAALGAHAATLGLPNAAGEDLLRMLGPSGAEGMLRRIPDPMLPEGLMSAPPVNAFDARPRAKKRGEYTPQP